MHDSADTFIVLRSIFMYPTNRGEVGAKNCSQTCPRLLQWCTAPQFGSVNWQLLRRPLRVAVACMAAERSLVSLVLLTQICRANVVHLSVSFFTRRIVSTDLHCQREIQSTTLLVFPVRLTEPCIIALALFCGRKVYP